AKPYVPLFATTSVSEFKRGLEEGSARSFGRFSHFEVFPTLNVSYGPSLMDSPSPDRKFMIGSPDFQPIMVQADRDIMPAACSTEPRHALLTMQFSHAILSNG